MLSKGMKRPAVSESGDSPQKRSATTSEMREPSQKYKAIREALLIADEFPMQVRQMLAASLEDSLGVMPDRRSSSQKSVVGWVGTALNSVREKMLKAIESAEVHVASADAERATRAEAESKAMEVVAQKSDALDVAREGYTAAGRVQQEARANLAAVESAVITHEMNLSDTARKESALRDVISKVANGITEGDGASKEVEALVVLGKELGLEASMLTALPSVIRKSVDARASFDTMVIDFFDKELQKRVADLVDVLAKGEAAKQDAMTNVTTAKIAVEVATKTYEDATQAFEKATREKKESDSILREAKLSLKQLLPEMTGSAVEMDTLKAQFQFLESGALAAFKEQEAPVSAALAEAAAPATAEVTVSPEAAVEATASAEGEAKATPVMEDDAAKTATNNDSAPSHP
eukprot:TRINITY_DN71596_c0_g1_i1.p1 TRINITY_DN71596_c0_g1~~TRINITY_DN71596_c0_g1_i1.p1  ORF type:complete len:428 (+),score=99.87 TRINITY_DN71596_c0_g1_i1:62-1285(+)